MLTQLAEVLTDFVSNETGVVRQRCGLPVAWVAGLLVTGAVIFSAPDQALAHCGGYAHYYGCSPGTECPTFCLNHNACGGVCESEICVCYD